MIAMIDMVKDLISFELLEEHIIKEFGCLQGCVHHAKAVAPPKGSIFQITEPLEACRSGYQEGLDGNNCISPGFYEVDSFATGFAGESHHLKMTQLGTGESIV